MSLSQFLHRLAELEAAGRRHNREMLKFLASSHHGAAYLDRELRRQGVSRAEFERDHTINVQAQPVGKGRAA